VPGALALPRRGRYRQHRRQGVRRETPAVRAPTDRSSRLSVFRTGGINEPDYWAADRGRMLVGCIRDDCGHHLSGNRVDFL